MHLELLTPPALISVDDDGQLRPALLLATRGDRRYVQVSLGPGANCLRWVAGTQVRPAEAAHPAPAVGPTSRGLPWVQPRTLR